MTKEKLLLIDGSSLAFRAFYSIMNIENFKNQQGLHTNALFSFHRMFENLLTKERPTHVLVAFDAGKVTFRTEMFAEYKGGRQKTPSEFREQMPYFSVLIDALGANHYRLDHYEADDIIGTLALKGKENQMEVVVVSGDKDLIQLAREGIRVEITTKGVSDLMTYTPEVIMEKFGLRPEQIIDLKGLMGDSSDNYPGVTGVGEKTALKLLHQYGSVENLYDHLDELKKSKLKENLIKDKESAFLSKTLARIHTDSPVEFNWDELRYRSKDTQTLLEFYREMNFNTFQTELLKSMESEDVPEGIESLDIQAEWIETIEDKHFTDMHTFYVELVEDNYHLAEVVAVSWGNESKQWVSSWEILKDSEIFRQWMEDPRIEKTVFDSKTLRVLMNRMNIFPQGIRYDLSLMAYLLDATDVVKEVADIAQKHQLFIPLKESIYGKGVKLEIPSKDTLTQYLAQQVLAMGKLSHILYQKLKELDQLDLYETMELPLSLVLAKMEIHGIHVEKERLEVMKVELEKRIQAIEQMIYEQAGEEFNINSTKQLGVILFEKLQLPVLKKTKTGYSTAVDVLEKLASRSPIVASILEYRQLAKLKSTYVEGLIPFILEDGRIHTRFIQTLTQTGRLSSADPNLQNIPIRTPEGRKIRHAFLPSKTDSVILSCDYSQIELRVLAHISKDPHMIEAFEDDQDIHTSTAMRVFSIQHPEGVTSQMRREAKAVNFGIVYGISDFGLSQNLNIPRKTAKEFIDRYLLEYPGVKQFMHDSVEFGRKNGYVETLFHRRRYLPDLHASNFNVRSFAERTAMNSPIQGTAADILKLAMIEIDQEITARKLRSTLLLQVHDELIFEVVKDELGEVMDLVKEVMENAVSLSVPLRVDANYGESWYEAK